MVSLAWLFTNHCYIKDQKKSTPVTRKQKQMIYLLGYSQSTIQKKKRKPKKALWRRKNEKRYCLLGYSRTTTKQKTRRPKKKHSGDEKTKNGLACLDIHDQLPKQ